MIAARELRTEFASVRRADRDGLGLVVRAGYGLPEGVIGGVLSVRRTSCRLRADREGR